jgi:hypothetical protein
MTMWKRCRNLIVSWFHPSEQQLIEWILREECGEPVNTRHLESCARCRQRWQSLRDRLERLGRLQEELPGLERELEMLRADLTRRLESAEGPEFAVVRRKLLGKAAEDPLYETLAGEILRTLIGERALADAQRRLAARMENLG